MKAILTVLVLAAAVRAAAAPSSTFVYVGSYTKEPTKEGITLLKMDDATGRLENLGVAAVAPNPTFLAVDASGEFLYAIHERQPGTVAAYKINRSTGALTLLNTESTGGPGPCHVAVDSKRRFLLAANYSGGSIACLPIAADGSLKKASSFMQHAGSSANPDRQKEPHAHGVYFSPDEKFVLATDLGTDKIYVYRLDAEKGTLAATGKPGSVKPGAGVRHGTFNPEGSKFYAINEIDCTITSFAWDADSGTLTERETVSTLTAPVPGNSTAEIAFLPGGKTLLGSNRGHNSLATYAVQADGALKLLGHAPTGGVPRHFGVHPSGKWVLAGGQNNNAITVLAVDGKSGTLTAQGEPFPVLSPVCIVFLPVP
jgi:6-phosphogluconolactonase